MASYARRRRRHAGLSSVSFASFVAAAVAAGELLVDLYFDEGSGLTITNYGSGGAPFNGALYTGDAGNSWADPTGLLFAAADDTCVTIGNDDALADLVTYTRVWAVTLGSAGEGNSGRFLTYDGSGLKAIGFDGSFNAHDMEMRYSTTNPRHRATALGFSTAKTVLFVQYDESGDRKFHVRLGVGGSVGTEISGDLTDTASVGSLVATSADEKLGNNANGGSGTKCLDGVMHRYMVFNRTLTGAERSIIANFFA